MSKEAAYSDRARYKYKLDVAATEEASSNPAAKNPSAKELRKEQTLAGMGQMRGGGQ